MSNSNRCTLAQLDKMDAEAVAAVPQDQLEMLLEDCADEKALLKKRNDRLSAEVERRCKDAMIAARQKASKDTGTINFVVGGRKVKNDIKKIVDWDQAELAKAVEVVRSWNSDPVTDYVKITYAVPEANWNAWPSAIKQVFEKARTVKSGAVSYEFVKEAA